MSTASGSWSAYWEGLAPRQEIFAAEARDLVRRLTPLWLVARPRRVLDFGCGFGYVSAGLAPLVPELWAWDAAASMRTHAAQRLAPFPGARVAAPGELDGPGAPRFDLILVNSVIQYMPPPVLGESMVRWARLLAPSGCVLLSDLPRPGGSGWAELLELLGFARREGFLGSAIVGGLAEARRYGRMRRERPLYEHAPALLEQLAGQAGLRARVVATSLTYRRGRMSAVLEHAGPASVAA